MTTQKSIESDVFDYRRDFATLAPPTLQLSHWRLDREHAELVRTNGSYPIPLERFTNPAEVVSILAQVAQKRWATADVLGELTAALVAVLDPHVTMPRRDATDVLTPEDITRRVRTARIESAS